MKRVLFVSAFLFSCASLPKRPIEFHPKSLEEQKEEVVYVCYQDGVDEKLVCMDFREFMQSMQSRPTSGEHSL